MDVFLLAMIFLSSVTLNVVWFLERKNSFESAPYVNVRVTYDPAVTGFETKPHLNTAKKWKGMVWIAFVNQPEAKVTVMEK